MCYQKIFLYVSEYNSLLKLWCVVCILLSGYSSQSPVATAAAAAALSSKENQTSSTGNGEYQREQSSVGLNHYSDIPYGKLRISFLG